MSIFFDSIASRLMPLFGLDRSPNRPGEPPRILMQGESPLAGLGTMETDANRMLSRRANGLYPNLDRRTLIQLLQDMDSTDLASSVLDMQAEDAVSYDQDTGESLIIEGPDDIKAEINECFRALGLFDQDRSFEIVRNMIHWGSEFQRLIYNSDRGVVNMVATNPAQMDIVWNTRLAEVVGYKEEGHTFKGNNSKVSWPYDYLHVKMSGRPADRPFGTSVLAAAIRPWTQMVLAEDRALLYRLTRQPDRLLFELDVGSASNAESWRMINSYRMNMRRSVTLDDVVGTLNSDYKPIGASDDLIIAKRSNSTSRVEMLQGSQNINDVGDLSYYGRKLLNATRTPPALFGFDDGRNAAGFEAKKKVSNQDVRYANHVIRIQQSYVSALMQLARIHLHLRAPNADSRLLRYAGDERGKNGLVIKMTPPSFLRELERLEVQQLRNAIAQDMLNMGQMSPALKPYEWTLFVLRKILRITEHDLKPMLQEPEQETFAGTGEPQQLPPGAEGGDGGSPFKAKAKEKKPAAQESTQPLWEHTEGGDLREEEAAQLWERVSASPEVSHRLRRLAALNAHRNPDVAET